MKASVCFIPESFNLSLIDGDLFSNLKSASALVKKMDNGFVSFYKSSDFDAHAANAIYPKSSSHDVGAVLSLLYDQQMNKAMTIEFNEEEVLFETDITPPVYGDTWISVYSSDENQELVNQPNRTIHSEECLVNYCSEILVNNPRSHSEYAKDFVSVFNNIIFLNNPCHKDYQTFDSIRKMDGGYSKFIKGITDCLSYINKYEIIPHDSKKNIGQLNAGLEFPITPEGKGKNKRAISALKRDFLIDGKVYESVNCEYHYKLERFDDANGNGTYYFNRIYFGFFNRIDPDNPRIAIAHIGEHL
jgi:hypothetical protein